MIGFMVKVVCFIGRKIQIFFYLFILYGEDDFVYEGWVYYLEGGWDKQIFVLLVRKIIFLEINLKIIFRKDLLFFYFILRI